MTPADATGTRSGPIIDRVTLKPSMWASAICRRCQRLRDHLVEDGLQLGGRAQADSSKRVHDGPPKGNSVLRPGLLHILKHRRSPDTLKTVFRPVRQHSADAGSHRTDDAEPMGEPRGDHSAVVRHDVAQIVSKRQGGCNVDRVE